MDSGRASRNFIRKIYDVFIEEEQYFYSEARVKRAVIQKCLTCKKKSIQNVIRKVHPVLDSEEVLARGTVSKQI